MVARRRTPAWHQKDIELLFYRNFMRFD